MTDAFAQFIPEARAFLTDLSAHNTRDWFADHKPQYEAQLKRPARLLLDQVAADLTRRTDTKVCTKLFRPQRDVRFSKDKTPYHTHLHMLWQVGHYGLFLGLSPSYVRVGGGIMAYDKSQLLRWRAAVDQEFGDQLQALLDILALRNFAPDTPELKRVPAPYDKSHPHGRLLRRKSLTVWAELPDAQIRHPVAALDGSFATLKPLLDLLGEAGI